MTEYSAFLKHLGIDKKQMLASMWSKIPESKKPLKRGQDMTKEQLRKEAEEKAKKRTKGFKCQDNCEKSYVMGALDFAEPREKRIAELKLKLEALDGQIPWKDIKDKSEVIGQLTKAKEIIKDYMIVVTGDHTTICSVPEENRCINVLKLNEQAEQFLNSEVEK